MNGKKAVVYILIIGCLAFLLAGAVSYPIVYFQMADPVNDEYGYGAYRYPGNIAFKPYKGLFDITEFKVWSEKPGEVNFDTSFGAITNPWAAPEGFIHQNLRIFIDTGPGGLAVLPQPGACVRFAPQAKWDVCLKIIGWQNSQLMIVDSETLKMWPLKTEVLGDGRTIRAQVDVARVGTIQKTWNYYVMVGSYDGFGEDFFRKVMRNNSEWVIGGGVDQQIEPLVLDIVAPAKGPNNQVAQLSSFNPKNLEYAQLVPVGNLQGKINGVTLLIWVLGLAVFLVIGLFFWFKPKKFSWFWVPKVKKTDPKQKM